MDALSACALSTLEIQDKFPLGLLVISFLCYADIVNLFVCVNALTACMPP